MANSWRDEQLFEDEVNALSVRLAQQIEASKRGQDSSKEAIATRRKRVLGGDFRFFAYSYFPHHIWGEPSIFQAFFCDLFPKLLLSGDGCLEAFIAPRGENKTTLISKIGLVYVSVLALLQREAVRKETGLSLPPIFVDYVMVLSAEVGLAKKILAVLKTELLHNNALAMDFPEVCGVGPQWNLDAVLTKSGVKFEPRGAQSAVRGAFEGASRPKLLIPDDIITDKEAKSPAMRESRWEWLQATIEYLGPPDGSVKVIWPGTTLNSDDPLARARRTIGYSVHHFKAIEAYPSNMDLWEECQALMLNDDKQWIAEQKEAGRNPPKTDYPSYVFYLAHKAAMDLGALVSWPSVRSLYDLMFKRAKNKKSFDTEMQGIARSDEDLVFGTPTFWVNRLRHWIYFGGCDPSMGKSRKSHPSAIAVGGWCQNTKKLHVVYADRKRRVPTKLQADLVAVQREFGCQAIGFENVNAYEFMRTETRSYALAQGVPLPLVGVDATVDKFVRIEGLEPYINSADSRILLHPDLKLLLDELEEFPEAQSDHDFDGLDALQILWHVASTRGAGVSLPVSTSKAGRRMNFRGYRG